MQIQNKKVIPKLGEAIVKKYGLWRTKKKFADYWGKRMGWCVGRVNSLLRHAVHTPYI